MGIKGKAIYKKDVPNHIKDWFNDNDVDYVDVIFKVDGVVDVLIFKNGWDNHLKNILKIL